LCSVCDFMGWYIMPTVVATLPPDEGQPDMTPVRRSAAPSPRPPGYRLCGELGHP